MLGLLGEARFCQVHPNHPNPIPYQLDTQIQLFWVSQDRVSLCNSPSCPGTLFGDQAGLKLAEVCGVGGSSFYVSLSLVK